MNHLFQNKTIHHPQPQAATIASNRKHRQQLMHDNTNNINGTRDVITNNSNTNGSIQCVYVVCLCTYMGICMRKAVRVLVCVCRCACSCAWACVCVCVYIGMCVYLYKCKCRCRLVCGYACVCVCAFDEQTVCHFHKHNIHDYFCSNAKVLQTLNSCRCPP